MKITKYEVLGKLPDPFLFNDGRRVKTLSDWEEKRKELFDPCVGLQYGGMPPEPEFLEIDPLCVPNTVGRMNIWRIRTGTREKPVSWTVYAHKPAGQGPWPVVIDGDLCYGCMQDPEIAEQFTSREIMLVKFNRDEIVPDTRNPKRTDNLYGTYPDLTFSALAAWAWGYSRTLDAMFELGIADPSSVTFTGLSRGGKSALLAGAVDERATIVCPEATCAGSGSCYRIHMEAETSDGRIQTSETLKNIVNSFPDWFGPGLKAYEDDEAALPFDSHMLKAMVAPRVLFDCEAEDDIWAGPVNTWMTDIAAREVWKLYGKEENVLWYWRRGGHAHLPEDFDMLIQVIEREKYGTPLRSEKFMKTPFPEPEPIFDWRCPERE
ncbi:MAG: hypothetical protein E7576_02470 [Ruminococcaceae bacterium]|jgi:hypothetical protein|nr:hypothetical protein [Oscillospiraceae bacterium]